LPFATAQLAVAAVASCGTKAKLVAQGGECLLATDCQDGLVCVPQADTTRICDSDLSRIQRTEDAAPPRDAARDGAGDAALDGSEATDATPDAAGGDDAAPD